MIYTMDNAIICGCWIETIFREMILLENLNEIIKWWIGEIEEQLVIKRKNFSGDENNNSNINHQGHHNMII